MRFLSISRQIKSFTFQTIEEELSSLCEVDIKVERKVVINDVQEARRDPSIQTELLPELKSVGVQNEELPVITRDFLNLSR